MRRGVSPIETQLRSSSRPRPARLAVLLVVVALAAPASASEEADGFGWTRLDKRVRPPGASAAAMAYDEARGEMVLFPGFDRAGKDGGTWVRRDGEWQRVVTGVEPEARYGAQMVYDAARQEIVLFGGYGRNPEGGPSLALNDTWTWNGLRWQQEQPASSPSRRAFPAAAYDRERQEIVLFGGIGIDDNGQAFKKLGDTWNWNGETWTRRQPATSPPVRNGAGMVFDEARGEILMFGGDGTSTPNQCLAKPMNICIDVDGQGGTPGDLADTWVWDGQTWTQRTTANAPDPRSNMGMAYDPARRRVVLFSGVNIGGLFWDTWTWDGTDWTEVTPAEQPAPRFSPSMAYDRALDRVVLWGGHRITYLGADTWAWDGQAWTSLEEPTPPERLDATLSTEPTSGLPLLFSGLGDKYFGDTWRYDNGWQRLSPTTSPSARFDATVASDTDRKEVVVFGGLASGDNLADTWVWNGSNWRDATPALPGLSPLARRSATMTYDQARDEVVLFGGWNSDLDVMFSDTWTWDGEGWTLEQVTGGPPALQEHMMAFDAARSEVVLYGGIDDENGVRSDTWTWDGDGWTREEPENSPESRAGSVMVYDPTIQRVLLLGGLGSERPLKVWAWNGSDWSDINVPPGPARATWSSMTYSPAAGGSVLFGAGEDAPDETWLLRLPQGQA